MGMFIIPSHLDMVMVGVLKNVYTDIDEGLHMKILYFDTETSGLNPDQNDILSIGGIIEIDGVVKEEFYFEVQPFNYETLVPQALEVNGFTVDKIKTFESPQAVHKKLVTLFSKYVNKYNKADKFTCVGHNVAFDMGFLNAFFRKNNDKYLGSFLDYHTLDTMILLNFLKYNKRLVLDNVKLVTACKHFGIELDAHNALNDIRATRDLFQKLCKF